MEPAMGSRPGIFCWSDGDFDVLVLDQIQELIPLPLAATDFGDGMDRLQFAFPGLR